MEINYDCDVWDAALAFVDWAAEFEVAVFEFGELTLVYPEEYEEAKVAGFPERRDDVEADWDYDCWEDDKSFMIWLNSHISYTFQYGIFLFELLLLLAFAVVAAFDPELVGTPFEIEDAVEADVAPVLLINENRDELIVSWLIEFDFPREMYVQKNKQLLTSKAEFRNWLFVCLFVIFWNEPRGKSTEVKINKHSNSKIQQALNSLWNKERIVKYLNVGEGTKYLE